MPKESNPSIPLVQPRRALNFEHALDQLEGDVSNLRDAVEELEQRLRPLLSGERLCGPDAERPLGASEIAERLLHNAGGISSQVNRIRDLIDRL